MLRVLFAASLLALVPSIARAQDVLCGIHSLYTAAHLLEVDARFADLLKPEFVGSDSGSSLAELESAAATLGLHALAVKNLTTNDLRAARWPIILHVKTDVASTQYNHFVLFGGMRDGKAIIYDGPREVEGLTLGEVAARWSGNALILSREPISISSVASGARVSSVVWLAAIGAVVAVMGMCQRRLTGWGRQIIVLLLISTCGAWAFHATTENGFLAAPKAVDAVRAANASTFLPKIDTATARRLFDAGEATFIDARSREEYEAGHIPGAVNLPGPMQEWDAQRVIERLPADRRMVVYCGNARCPFFSRRRRSCCARGIRTW